MLSNEAHEIIKTLHNHLSFIFHNHVLFRCKHREALNHVREEQRYDIASLPYWNCLSIPSRGLLITITERDEIKQLILRISTQTVRKRQFPAGLFA